MSTTWKRLNEPGGDAEYANGPWRLCKEFFADGPSLFEWVLTNELNPRFRKAFATKKQATAWVDY